jgi:hypothetical protein
VRAVQALLRVGLAVVIGITVRAIVAIRGARQAWARHRRPAHRREHQAGTEIFARRSRRAADYRAARGLPRLGLGPRQSDSNHDRGRCGDQGTDAGCDRVCSRLAVSVRGCPGICADSHDGVAAGSRQDRSARASASSARSGRKPFALTTCRSDPRRCSEDALHFSAAPPWALPVAERLTQAADFRHSRRPRFALATLGAQPRDLFGAHALLRTAKQRRDPFRRTSPCAPSVPQRRRRRANSEGKRRCCLSAIYRLRLDLWVGGPNHRQFEPARQLATPNGASASGCLRQLKSILIKGLRES